MTDPFPDPEELAPSFGAPEAERGLLAAAATGDEDALRAVECMPAGAWTHPARRAIAARVARRSATVASLWAAAVSHEGKLELVEVLVGHQTIGIDVMAEMVSDEHARRTLYERGVAARAAAISGHVDDVRAMLAG